ncbi:MAG: redoxin domain-containing protein, partial [Elusimicrobia bacterium]|nr:redoxin domain-containing protein [Elusimicrobiota bacterium]
MTIQIGQKAPDFHLQGVVEGKIMAGTFSLSDCKGKWVIVFFYPLDFTFVCPTEIIEFNKRYKEFTDINTVILGISVDSVYSHEAWAKDIGKISYPLLSDMTKSASKDYGVLIEDQGIALRGTFIIDPDQNVRCQVVHDINIGRSVSEHLRVLKALQGGNLCQVEWTPGSKT